jgi:hypothetical protein
MITQANAVAVGKAICDTARKADADKERNPNAYHIVRGTCITALDIIWYDVLPQKTKEMFNFSKQEYYRQCNWPA